MHLQVTDTIVEDDKITFLPSGDGTRQGPLGPIPASGTHLTWEVIDICRFKHGRIIEHWGIGGPAATRCRAACPTPAQDRCDYLDSCSSLTTCSIGVLGSWG